MIDRYSHPHSSFRIGILEVDYCWFYVNTHDIGTLISVYSREVVISHETKSVGFVTAAFKMHTEKMTE